MECKKIIVCRGIQGSGKTTWAYNWVNEAPKSRVRINNDDLRNMCGKYWVPEREEFITDIRNLILLSAIEKGYDIVIDNMNLSAKLIKDIYDYIDKFAKYYGFNYILEFKDFFIPLQECIERDSKREHPIGAKIINETYLKYKDRYNWK